MFDRRQNLIAEKFRQYLVPTILMAMSTSIAMVVDGIIVGNLLGPAELAAVNLALPLMLCFSTIYAMMGAGGSTLISIARGERKPEKEKRVFFLSIAMMTFGGLLFTVAGIAFMDPITTMLTSEVQLRQPVADYSRLLLIGAPLVILVHGITFFIRSDGNPGFASKVLIIANIVNLGMDVVYIHFLGMGIAGAALATLTGYLVGGIMAVAFLSGLAGKHHALRFEFARSARGVELLEIMGTGITSALGQIGLFAKILAVNHIVLTTVGTPGMVAFSVCLSSLSLVSMFISGATQTMMPIAGAMYGEKDWSGIRFTVKRALRFVMISSLVLVILIELFPGNLLSLYGIDDPVKMAIGIEALRWFAPSLVGVGFSFVVMYYTQTIRRTGFSAAVSIMQGLLVIPIALFLSRILGAVGIWVSFIVAEVMTAAFAWCVAAAIRKKHPGQYETIFLFPKTQDAAMLDMTIFSNTGDVSGVSRRIIDFVAARNDVDRKTAALVGLAAEEMAMYIINRCYGNSDRRPIDIMVRVDETEVILRFLDSGAPLNPAHCPEESEREACSNIFLLRQVASTIDYARVTGLNSTIVRVRLQPGAS